MPGPSNVGPNCGVRQVVGVTPGRQYMLSFWVGRATPSGGPGGVHPGAATVDLSIDGGPRISFTNSDVTNNRINWKRFSYSYTPSGSTMTIDFLNGTPLGTNETGLDGVALDQVAPVAVLPEWGVIALSALLTAASGVALARRTRSAT